MPDGDTKVNPKVHAGAAPAGVGGGGAAVLLIWLLQVAFNVPEASFTPERVVALTGACAWLGGYLGGWLKSS